VDEAPDWRRYEALRVAAQGPEMEAMP
jgi:hypothetical protein